MPSEPIISSSGLGPPSVGAKRTRVSACPARSRRSAPCLRSCRSGWSIDRRRAPPATRRRWSTRCWTGSVRPCSRAARAPPPRSTPSTPASHLDDAFFRHDVHSRQPLRVDDDRCARWPHGAAHAAARAVGHQADALAPRQRDDRLDLLGALGPHHELRPGTRLWSAAPRDQVPRPGVARRGRAVHGALAHGKLGSSSRAARPDAQPLVPLQPRDVYRGTNARFSLLLRPRFAAAPVRRRRAPARAQVSGGRTTAPRQAERLAAGRRRGRGAKRGRSAKRREAANCDDGTCSTCGSGICPAGWYCDEKASGGGACSWLTECADKPTCACVTRVLGAACKCRKRAAA